MRLNYILRAGEEFRYWTRYVERRMQYGYRDTLWHPLAGWQEKDRKHWHYGLHREWTDEAREEQEKLEVEHKKSWMIRNTVKPIKQWNMFTGDRVMILVGKDNGRIGEISSIIKQRNWIIVDGLNLKHTNNAGFCMAKEAPLLATSQVSLIDPEDNQPTKVEWRYTKSGERVRVSQRTGRLIPLPPGYQQYPDLVIPKLYAGNKMKDTADSEVKRLTFEPKLTTFEQDIMQGMVIKCNKQLKPTYWY